MIKRLLLFILMIGGASFSLQAQCDIAFDEVDDFDSTRVIGAPPVKIGKIVPSLYETIDGPTFIDQAKVLATYSEGDSINSFFITIAIPEYSFQPIEKGNNVLIKLSDGKVLSIYNVPDRGTFDKETNMRIYQHTCVIPLDLFYRLTFSYIEAIRINYQKHYSTIELDIDQQQAVRSAIQCVGRASGLYPVKP